MNHYISLLKSEPVFAKLSLMQLISYFGAWFTNVAIYTLLLDMKVSAEVIAFTAALHFIAGVVQAPFSGSVIDRVKPKKLMLLLLGIEIVTTLLLVFVTDVSHLWLLFTLIFMRMAAASFYFTTVMSLLPKLLDGDKLQKANEIHSIIWSISYTLGMAISGFIVYLFGVTLAFIIDACMFMISFYILYGLSFEVNTHKHAQSFLFMMKDTFGYLKRSPKALHLMFLHAFVGLTAFDALVALIVDKYYASILAVSLALGLLHAARAIGLVIGPIILGEWINNKRLFYLFIFQAFGIWLWAILIDNFYLSLAASVVVGLFTTTLWSYTYTLLQKNIEEQYYGRIVAYNDMLFLISAAATSLMIGALASSDYSLEFITFILGSGFIVGGVYFAWVLKTQNIKEVN